jgi:LPXTG-motif cell wall-anchored protein
VAVAIVLGGLVVYYRKRKNNDRDL